MRKPISIPILCGAAVLLAAGPAHRAVVTFEPEPQLLGENRSPKFIARRAHGLLTLATSRSESGRGMDVIYQSSSDLGDTFTPPQRVNNVPGEVSDHGENSPQLLVSPDEMTLYAVWNARDPNDPQTTNIRFSRSGAMNPAWAPALTLNDDGLPVSHGFQSAAVGPDGTIYVAWLDGRDRAGTSHEGHQENQYTGGTSSIYLTTSQDGGKTFSRNVRVARNICPCCRPTFGFAAGKVIIGWRLVEPGDVRDIYVAVSEDKGQTWSEPTVVGRDGWKIKGCPHVGPAMASLGSKLYVAWFTEGSGDPAIYYAVSSDGGKTFEPKKRVSDGVLDPTHPYLTADEEKIALVFQARDPKQQEGWGKMGVYYREIYAGGKLSELTRAGQGKANASYPTVALGLSGRVFIGWTETSEGASKAYLLRGRAAGKSSSVLPK